MAIFKRIREIISASINDLLDATADPEKMINQMIREIDQSIAELRKNVASTIALQKMIERRSQKAKAEQRTWSENAELALMQGKEDMAKRALEKKLAVTETVLVFENQIEEHEGVIARLKEDLKLVEEKAQEARTKRETLIMKKRSAESRQKLAESIEKVEKSLGDALHAADRIINGFDGFNTLEEKIDEQVVSAEVRTAWRRELQVNTLAKEFEKIKRDKVLGEELKALKRKLEK